MKDKITIMGDKAMSSIGRISAIQYGLGPIGCSIARYAMERGIEIVGAVDINPKLAGQDLGDVLGTDRKLGVLVSVDENEVLPKVKADIVLHAISSSLKEVAYQLESIMKAGCNVVSTCEELAYPWTRQSDLAKKIDRIAKNNKVTVLATGVNPGFVMDTWPILMTAVCKEVRKIKVARIQDARPRRFPFQKKIGAGRTVEEFKKLADAGTVRHVGLAESIAMIAAAMGWKLDSITEDIEPVIADKQVKSDFITVQAGEVAGVKQIGVGKSKGEELVRLEFEAYLGAPESYDTVYINGTPDMEVSIKGGTFGDIATAAIVINAIPRVLEASAGLMTMMDIPLVHAYRAFKPPKLLKLD